MTNRTVRFESIGRDRKIKKMSLKLIFMFIDGDRISVDRSLKALYQLDYKR